MIKSSLKEPVSEHFINIESFRRVLLQYFVYKGLSFGAYLWRVFVVDIHYSLHGLLPTDVVEGSLAADHFISQNSNTPYVNTVIVSLPSNDLWRYVIECSAVGGPSILANSRPSKITKFAYTLGNKMNTLVMTIFYGLMSL